jgi:hypothetical protein
LSIVASQDIGAVGPRDGQPVVFDWRWYHYLPGLPVWIVVFVVLLLLRRAWRARTMPI